MTTKHIDDNKILELFLVYNLNYNQIAHKLNCAPESIKDRLHKLNVGRLTKWHPAHLRWAGCHQNTYKHHERGLCAKCCGSTIPDGTSCEFCNSTISLISHKNVFTACSICSKSLGTSSVLRWAGKHRKRIPTLAMSPITTESKIAIIGASGFVGQNLLNHLKPHFQIIPAYRVDCNAMDEGSIRKFIRLRRPDVVVNLAAFVGGIGLNKDNPADMFYRNLVMGSNILNACFTMGVRKLVYLGSVCSYPHTPPHIPFQETDLWQGRPEPTNEPYGIAKKSIGMLLDAYKRQFNFSSAYLIPTNMYGPGDDFSLYASHVIPAMIRKFSAAAKNGEQVVLWGDGTPSREFLYVDDCCEAIRQAIIKKDDPTPINLGSGVETSMGELAALIASLTGYRGDIVWDNTRPNGQPRRCLNVDRARTILGFEAKTKLNDGLRTTVDWYKENETNGLTTTKDSQYGS